MMRDTMLVWAFRAAWRWTPRIPEPVAMRAATRAADLMWLRNGRGVRQLQGNLARVRSADLNAVRDLTRTTLRGYARYWCQLFRLSALSDADRMARVVVHHRERIDRALEDGRGVILAATHSGNWDLAGTVVAPMFDGVTTVAERLRPEALFDLFARERRKFGMEILPHRGGERPALDVLTERLQAGRVVALVSDRDLSRRGVEVRFFDGIARMGAGPAALAVATGAPLIPCAVWSEDGVTHVLAHQPLEVDRSLPDAVNRVTQQLADVFARDIAAHPDDWYMLQPVWIEDL